MTDLQIIISSNLHEHITAHDTPTRYKVPTLIFINLGVCIGWNLADFICKVSGPSQIINLWYWENIKKWFKYYTTKVDKIKWISKTKDPNVSLLSRLLHFFEHLSRLCISSKNNVKRETEKWTSLSIWIYAEFQHVWSGICWCTMALQKAYYRHMRKGSIDPQPQ